MAFVRPEGVFRRRRDVFSCCGRRQRWGLLAVACFGRWGFCPPWPGQGQRLPGNGAALRVRERLHWRAWQSGACSLPGRALTVVVSRPGLARHRAGFSVRCPWLVIAVPEQAGVFGREVSAQMGEHVAFRPKVFSVGCGARDAQPRVQPTRLSAVGKRRGFESWAILKVC